MREYTLLASQPSPEPIAEFRICSLLRVLPLIVLDGVVLISLVAWLLSERGMVYVVLLGSVGLVVNANELLYRLVKRDKDVPVGKWYPLFLQIHVFAGALTLVGWTVDGNGHLTNGIL